MIVLWCISAVGYFGCVVLLSRLRVVAPSSGRRNLHLRRASHRFVWHVRFIALWDLVMLTNLCGVAGLQNFDQDETKITSIFSILSKCTSIFGNMVLFGVLWQTLVLTLERFLMIYKPLKCRQTVDFVPVYVLFGVIAILGCVLAPAGVHDNFLNEDFLHTEAEPKTARSIEDVNSSRSPLNRSGASSRTLFLNSFLFFVFYSPTPALVAFVLSICTACAAIRVRVGSNYNEGSQRRRRIPAKAICSLAMLNLKLLVCALVLLVDHVTKVYALDLKHRSAWAHLTRAMKTYALACNSATNWLLFVSHSANKYDDCSTAHHSSRSQLSKASNRLLPLTISTPIVRKLRSSNDNNREIYRAWLAQSSTKDFGRRLIILVCQRRPELGKQLYNATSNDELMSSVSLATNGGRITQFISDMLFKLTTRRTDLEQTRVLLREIGAVHRKMNVKLETLDWQMFVRQMVTFMDLRNSEQRDTMRSMAAFIVTELKNGYLCEEVASTARVDIGTLMSTPTNRKVPVELHSRGSDASIQVPNSTLLTTNRSLISRNDALPLYDRWCRLTRVEKKDFGRQLLIHLCKIRPELGERLYDASTEDQLWKSVKLASNGGRITQRLGELIFDLCDTRVDMSRVRQATRHIGAMHAKAGVLLEGSDWEIITAFMESFLELTDKRQKESMSKLVNFIVLELKRGYKDMNMGQLIEQENDNSDVPSFELSRKTSDPGQVLNHITSTKRTGIMFINSSPSQFSGDHTSESQRASTATVHFFEGWCFSTTTIKEIIY